MAETAVLIFSCVFSFTTWSSSPSLCSSYTDRMQSADARSIHWEPHWKEVKVLVAQSCPTLCDPMHCSPPGSSVHGIFQVRILEWVAISFSRGSSWPKNWTRLTHIAGRCFTLWTIREAPITERGVLKFPTRLWICLVSLFYQLVPCIFSCSLVLCPFLWHCYVLSQNCSLFHY